MHAPLIDDCTIEPNDVICNHSRTKAGPKQPPTYNLTPLKATGYLCYSTGDFVVAKYYLITLEDNLAKCIQTPIEQPKVSDCVIAGASTAASSMVYCSDGVASNGLTWLKAQTYLCLSPADYQLEKIYQNTLIQDIANCTPP